MCSRFAVLVAISAALPAELDAQVADGIDPGWHEEQEDQDWHQFWEATCNQVELANRRNHCENMVEWRAWWSSACTNGRWDSECGAKEEWRDNIWTPESGWNPNPDKPYKRPGSEHPQPEEVVHDRLVAFMWATFVLGILIMCGCCAITLALTIWWYRRDANEIAKTSEAPASSAADCEAVVIGEPMSAAQVEQNENAAGADKPTDGYTSGENTGKGGVNLDGQSAVFGNVVENGDGAQLD